MVNTSFVTLPTMVVAAVSTVAVVLPSYTLVLAVTLLMEIVFLFTNKLAWPVAVIA